MGSSEMSIELSPLLWLAGGAILAVLFLCVLLGLLARNLLLRYVDVVLGAEKWFVAVCFILFPPAFVAFLVGLVFWAMREKKAEKDLVRDVTDIYWERNPPSERLQGDEETRRAVAVARRKLGYDD
jgi:hypothetical protein